MLAERGLDHSHIVRMVEQVAPDARREIRATGEDRKKYLGPLFPASTGVLVPALPHPDVLLALDIVASTDPKEIINPGWEIFDELTFSPAVKAGNMLYISGTPAWNPETNETVAAGEIEAQARFAYEQIGIVCEAAGGSMANLVKTIEYVTPAAMDNYRSVGGLRKELLGRPYPAATGVVISGLMSRQWVIEVESIAVLD